MASPVPPSSLPSGFPCLEKLRALNMCVLFFPDPSLV